ncbi:VirB3 family type IV secretion system protein, partial [Helicobacter typhlonius]|uniref:VirB3 family type IV secretion system protein n=1 Tax=Helicobacter typhlonius TaxID=76936 RepID=UPI002FE29EB7
MVQPLFKGLTRPALLFGVPMLPLLATFGLLLLITFWTQSFALLFLAIPLFFIEKAMAKKDPYIFRLFMLKAMFLTNPFSKKFHSVKTYSATSYTKKQMARAEVPKLNIIALNNEANFEKLIPYSSIIAPSVVMTKDYLLLSTYRIDGICFEAESDINLSFINESLNMCFRAFSNEPVSFYFHNVRHRINDSLDSAFDNPYLNDVDEKYKQSFKDKTLLKNSLFITIIYSPLGRLDKGVFKKASVKDKQKQLTSFLYIFKEYKARFESNIKQFGVALLGEYEKNGIKFSKQLEFYNYLIGGRFTPTRILDMPLY